MSTYLHCGENVRTRSQHRRDKGSAQLVGCAFYTGSFRQALYDLTNPHSFSLPPLFTERHRASFVMFLVLMYRRSSLRVLGLI